MRSQPLTRSSARSPLAAKSHSTKLQPTGGTNHGNRWQKKSTMCRFVRFGRVLGSTTEHSLRKRAIERSAIGLRGFPDQVGPRHERKHARCLRLTERRGKRIARRGRHEGSARGSIPSWVVKFMAFKPGNSILTEPYDVPIVLPFVWG